MNRAAVALVGLAVLLPAAPANAQLARTFVSANGADANNCSRMQPCRTFQGAHDKTNSGGEINVLDPAGYGVVTITKALSIVNDGVGSAGVLVGSGQTGIIINAGSLDAVNLRGLIIEGAGLGQKGIVFNSGKSLTIENCVVRGLTGVNDAGIRFAPNASSNLAVSNTLVVNNAGTGIEIAPGGSAVVGAAFNRVESHNNGGFGISLIKFATNAAINATATESVATGNYGGFFALANGPPFARLTVVRSVAANNTNFGVGANSGGANVRLAQSTVTGNPNAWSIGNGGVVESYGDNYVDGNSGDNSAQPLIAKK